MTAEDFVRRLDDENQRLLGRLAPDDTLKPEVAGELTVVNLLKVALKNEIEATEIAARWLVTNLDTLATTVERVAAGQFTREAIAIVKNRQFIAFCENAGDRETAALYRDVIEPDERHHRDLGSPPRARLLTPSASSASSRAGPSGTSTSASRRSSSPGSSTRRSIRGP